jgi:hypothetical protein
MVPTGVRFFSTVRFAPLKRFLDVSGRIAHCLAPEAGASIRLSASTIDGQDI